MNINNKIFFIFIRLTFILLVNILEKHNKFLKSMHVLKYSKYLCLCDY